MHFRPIFTDPFGLIRSAGKRTRRGETERRQRAAPVDRPAAGGQDGVMALLPSGALPVVAAPMAGGPTTPGLVVAAARAGALGFLATGYRTPDQLTADLAAVRAQTDS